ncbi:MAG: DUF1178 family protein [Hyphomicrobium sp.]
MIKFALRCAAGHGFEAWFRSGDTYDRQSRLRLVACPTCGSVEVDKQPMAPALLKGGRKPPEPHAGAAQPDTPSAPVVAGPDTEPPLELQRAWKRHIMAHSEDVGRNFAEEARKIHHGEAEERAIRGETSTEDARRLSEDGIPFGVLPVLPEDHN